MIIKQADSLTNDLAELNGLLALPQADACTKKTGSPKKSAPSAPVSKENKRLPIILIFYAATLCAEWY